MAHQFFIRFFSYTDILISNTFSVNCDREMRDNFTEDNMINITGDILNVSECPDITDKQFAQLGFIEWLLNGVIQLALCVFGKNRVKLL